MTNGLGDGLREYVENQVKNFEGNNVLFVRKKFEVKEKDTKPDEPAEYKENTQDSDGNSIDPNSFVVTLAQAETVAKEISDVKTVTPRYSIDGEYITFDGAKKYQLNLGMMSEGLTQKTEAGKTIDGKNQILLPLSLAKAFSSDLQTLIGREITIGYKVGQGGEMRTMNLNQHSSKCEVICSQRDSNPCLGLERAAS